MASSSLLRKGAKLVGEGGRSYALASPLAQRSGIFPNVWKAVDSADSGSHFVIKHPHQDDAASENWPAFRKEVDMQNLFKPARFVRRMIDIIPPKSDSGPRMMVLEPFEKNLWTARTRRRFTTKEIKHVMKLALLGLNEIHEQGLVYCDFKMENVLLNGFDDEKATSDDEKESVKVQVKLSDLGSAMPPNQGKVTSITYRSPEVYLDMPWTSATDIWSWGIAFFHLIQAQHDFDSPGIYDSIIKGGTLKQKADAVLSAMCDDFELRSVEYFKGCNFPPSKANNEDGATEDDTQHWSDRLLVQGASQYDIEFLYAVLQPDPTKRMTVAQILDTGYLDVY